jgi:Multisubunit Na+/H+ antiporter, MnhE subunit
MKRLLPAPLLSVALFVLWLLLNQSLSPGNLLLAAGGGVAGAPAHARAAAPAGAHSPPRHGAAAGSDGGGRHRGSNLAVARLLLAPGRPRHAAAFVHIPLELRDPNALAVLAMIVCITPGTAWAELSLDRSMLMLHALEVDDPQTLIDHVKQRYERPLMEIFE